MNPELLWTLFWEFFKTGLFAVGGGLSTVPFLYDMMDRCHWFTRADLLNMIAVSEATPGPMGINMATYVGYHASGNNIIGAIIATVGLVLPSMIIICIIARFLKAFRDSHWVQDAFYGLRPAVCALIVTAGLGVFEATVTQSGGFLAPDFFGNIRWLPLVLFALLLFIELRFKKIHPIAMIAVCALIGIVLQL